MMKMTMKMMKTYLSGHNHQKKNVDDDTDDTSKVDILRKKVKSLKSIASRIKDYSKKIGDKGVQYSISGPLPDYDILAQQPKSDMKGFLSPRAK